MIEVNTREFTRHFAELKAKALAGESIRLRAREGTFVFEKELAGLTAGDLLRRLERLPDGTGPMAPGGADRIERGREHRKPAHNPWDRT